MIDATRYMQMADMIRQSRAMMEMAEAGDWDEVLKCEALRRGMIDKFFSMPVPEKEAADVARTIREMLTVNDQLVKLTGETRDSMADGVSSVSQGRRAVKEYISNSL